MSVNAVLFDFGMVLSGPPSPMVWAEMKQLTGLDDQSFHRAYWALRDDYDSGTLNGKTYWQKFARQADVTLSEDILSNLVRLDLALWTEMNTAMVEWVQALHRAGIRTGILSNMGDAMSEGISRKFDWIGNFHHTVWSHAYKTRKPEPEIYAAAATGLGIPPNQILFVDDKLENIEAAVRFGMQGIVYSDHESFQHEMRERGMGYLLDVGQLIQTV